MNTGQPETPISVERNMHYEKKDKDLTLALLQTYVCGEKLKRVDKVNISPSRRRQNTF